VESRRLRIFSGEEVAPGSSMRRSETVYPVGYQAEPLYDGLHLGLRSGVLYQGDQPGDFSLLAVDLAPNAIISRHYHDNDCLYIVSEGEILMGARVIKKGGGFFVGAEQPYTYQAGAEGARVLEVRSDTTYATTVVETNVARVFENARANRAVWGATAETSTEP